MPTGKKQTNGQKQASKIRERCYPASNGARPGGLCHLTFMNEKQLKKRNTSDLQAVLKTASGRRVLWRLLQAARVRQHAFVPGDTAATAFHCGQQSIGLFLLAEIEEAAPNAYVQMRGEYLSEVNSEQHEIDRLTQELTHV